jgi:hypothetical protein
MRPENGERLRLLHRWLAKSGLVELNARCRRADFPAIQLGEVISRDRALVGGELNSEFRSQEFRSCRMVNMIDWSA